MQASRIGCHIIHLTPDLLRKLPLLGKNLIEHSLDLVRENFGGVQSTRLAPETSSIRNLEFTLKEAARIEAPAVR